MSHFLKTSRAETITRQYANHLTETTKQRSSNVITRARQFQTKVKTELEGKSRELKQLKEARDTLQRKCEELMNKLQDREAQYKQLQVSRQ